VHTREVVDDYYGGFWGHQVSQLFLRLITIVSVSVFNSCFILGCI